MAMTIQNNSGTMMALGQMKKNDSSLSKQLKKVSSGMRINDAGDDASGYSISERMRTMIRALGQDIQNAKNGKDLVGVAEGGMQDILDNLREMKAMAINAANDHNTDLDRQTLEKEFASRKETITDIAASTNYNGKLLLTGDYAQWHMDKSKPPASTLLSDFQPAFGSCSPNNQKISGGRVPVDASYVGQRAPTVVTPGTPSTYTPWNYWTATGQTAPASTSQKNQIAVALDFSNLNASYPSGVDGKGFSILCGACQQYIDIIFDASTTNTTYDSSPAPPPGKPKNSQARAFTVGVQNVTNAADLAKAIFDGISSVQNSIAGKTDTTDPANIQIDSGHNLRLAEINGSYYFLKNNDQCALQFINGIYGGPKNNFEDLPLLLGTPLIIHTGTKANEHQEIFINSMYPKDMKMDYKDPSLEDAHVTPLEAALEALGILDSAVDYTLNEITRMGAYQMRLGQTEENLVTNEENTQSAESTIRDADMAKEMTGYAKANILTQAAQSMLAQANQNSSNVLSLLQ